MRISETSIILALKGYLIGAANVVPGVSGGTFALITGIYQPLIDSLDSLLSPSSWKPLFKGRLAEFWKAVNGGFLLAVGYGMIFSVFTLARLITYTLAHYPVETWALFFGLILASAFYMFKDLRPVKGKDILFALLGVALGVAVCTLSPTETPDGKWFIFLCGAIAICSMILPGVSGSLMLVLLCKYDYIMEAVSGLDLGVLIVFGLGCAVGILAFSKFLHWLLQRWERPTMMVLLGFVVGSLVKVWPWSNMEEIALSQGFTPQEAVLAADMPQAFGLSMHIPQAILWMVIGVAAVVVIERLGAREKKSA